MKPMHRSNRRVFSRGESTFAPSARTTFTAAGWLLVMCALSASAMAADRIEVGEKLARFDLIQPVERHYLRYMKSDDRNLAVDIWTREVRFDERDGVRRLHIVQHWDGPAKSERVATRDSWFEADTFRPLTHERVSRSPERSLTESFRFEPSRIVQLVAEPGQEEKIVESPQPAFNFETDMEFLGALPLAAGYEADIVFYHPGGKPPASYRFRVAGSERLPVPGGGTVDSWLVTTDYNRPGPVSRFWLDKKTQTVLKVESPMPDGGMMVKMLLY